MNVAAEVSPAFRRVMAASAPAVRRWGRLEVSGLETLPASGPVLLAGNHDSWWDPIVIGSAAVGRRQIQALAKSSLWKYGPVGRVLDGMGQIPIDRGGACIGIFLEGTRSRGRELRARSGFGRIAQAVPEAEVVLCTVIGTTDIIRFPKRPQVRVRFFRPADGGLQPGETPSEFGTRLLAEIRAEAPRAAFGRRPKPADPAA
jgi:1-acyl-sn-glycerol-3-phosphate acyltransferase